MEKIIIKKVREKFTSNGSIGFFKPVFIERDKNLKLVKIEDFPNDGVIYMPKESDNFDSYNLYYVDRDDITDNYKYEEQLKNFQENPTAQNPSKFVIYSNKVRKNIPIDLIPIYSNKFSFKTQNLLNYNNIESEIFFLEDGNDIYGPFKKNNIELSAANFKSYEDEFQEYDEFQEFLELYSEYNGEFIFKINKDDISDFLINDSDSNKYLIDFKSVVKNNTIAEPLLFCDDSELLKWGKRKLNSLNPDFKKIIDSINELSDRGGNDKADSSNLKWERFKELLQNDTGEEELEDVKNILSEKGVLQIQEDSKQNEELEELKKKIDVKDDEIRELKDNIESLKIEQSSINQVSHEFNFDKFPNIKKAIEAPENLEETLKIKEDNNRLGARKDLLNEDIAKLEKSKTEIEASVKEIVKGFERSASEHTVKLVESKYYTDMLNGIDVGISQSSNNDERLEFEPSVIDVSKGSAKEYVQEMRERLKNQERDLSFNDVANLIITVNQSFLTILAGAPGVGKTSLADKFSKSLGLSEQFGYLEIPCAKGWNSAKDLIGFYNPITQKFQDSKTKLRDALKASSKHKNAPFIVLLDEANLSPMEHYWSDFIKLADFNYERKIKISDKEAFEFGEGFRFLATINHDHTTEMLSNRLLDRASIIQIEKPTNDDNIQILNNQIHSEIFDCNSVATLFKETSKWGSERKWLINKLDEIIKLLEDNHSGLIISPRKRNSVIKYMQVATGLLDGNDYIALDFAITQQILPLINMRGDSDSLLKIKEITQKVGMEKSTSLLSKIVERGKEFKHFKYIYY